MPSFTTITILALISLMGTSTLALPATRPVEITISTTMEAQSTPTIVYDTPIPQAVNDDSAFPPIVPVNTRANDDTLISALAGAASAGDRYKLLNQPGDFVFDFNNAPEDAISSGNGGRTVASNSRTFPALIGNGASMSVGFLGACGLNTPHIHPRGTELNLIVQGRLVTNFIPQNGVPAIENTMETFQMSVFPQGAVHAEYNPDCTDAVFVAGFPSEDPGVEQVAETLFGLRGDIVKATLGGVDIIDGADLESFRDLIPANVAAGVDACLQKCGIPKKAKRDITVIN